MNYENELDFMKALADEAGEIMLRYFNAEDVQTEWKSDNSPVTVADTKINSLVIQRVRETFPDYGILGEEEKYNETADTLIVCDPIDGTVPYDLGVPVSTFCLAKVVKGVTKLAVVYDPFQKNLYHAVSGQGAFLNDKKIHVSETTDLKNSYMSVSDSFHAHSSDIANVRYGLRKKGVKILSLVSYAYSGALVANGGMLAAFMSYGSPWDAAAISLIVEEAGGKATDLAGSIRDYSKFGNGILLSNGAVHDEILRMIKNENTRD